MMVRLLVAVCPKASLKTVRSSAGWLKGEGTASGGWEFLEVEEPQMGETAFQRTNQKAQITEGIKVAAASLPHIYHIDWFSIRDQPPARAIILDESRTLS